MDGTVFIMRAFIFKGLSLRSVLKPQEPAGTGHWPIWGTANECLSLFLCSSTPGKKSSFFRFWCHKWGHNESKLNNSPERGPGPAQRGAVVIMANPCPSSSVKCSLESDTHNTICPLIHIWLWRLVSNSRLLVSLMGQRKRRRDVKGLNVYSN